jgi:hypothetical protein
MDQRSRSREVDTVAMKRLTPLDAPSVYSRLLCAAYDWRRRKFAPTESDQMLLRRAMDSLKLTGCIEYTGEFGAEITTFIPFVAWLAQRGELKDRHVISYEGMLPYYPFLEEGVLLQKSERRRWVYDSERAWPGPSTYFARPSSWQISPNYRRWYRHGGPRFERPILFVQNKFTVENESGPVNFLPVWAIRQILDRLEDKFDIVYSRPNLPLAGYSVDENSFCDYPDLVLLRGRPHVTILEEMCVERGLDYNLTKLQILAQCRVMIGVQGGGSHLLACFGGSLLIIYDIRSFEFPGAYMRGPYKYLSRPAPTLWLVRSDKLLYRTINLVAQVQPLDDGVALPAQLHDYAKRRLQV